MRFNKKNDNTITRISANVLYEFPTSNWKLYYSGSVDIIKASTQLVAASMSDLSAAAKARVRDQYGIVFLSSRANFL